MVSEEQLKAVLETVKETAGTMQRGGGHGHDDECCCSKVVVYVIYANCTTVNNCAQEDWEFCEVDGVGL